MSYAARAPSVLVAALILFAALWVPTPAIAADEPTASFGEDVTTVTRGDVVEIRVSHSQPGTLHIGGDDYGYHLTVELGGSGTTTITIDTYNSTGKPKTYVSGGGNKTLHTAELRRPIEPAAYLMNVTIDGVERAIGQLEVEPRGNTSATTTVAPASLNDSDSKLTAKNVREAVTERQKVAKGDLAVIQLNESGLESALKPGDVTGGANASGIEISLNQLEVRPNHEQQTFLATPENGTTIVPDFENDVVYVVWDTSDLPLEGDEETYEARVTLQGNHSGFVEEDTITARSRVRLVEPTVSVNVDNETVYPWESLRVNVTGKTTLAPGSTVELRARAPGQPFLKLVPITVESDGTLTQNLTFAPDDRGLSFPMWIRDYRDETERTMRLLESDASLRFVDQETDGTFVTISEVNLSVGGFVTVETADEEPLGTSAYLPAGSHKNVIVDFDRRQLTDSELLAIAYADRDRNQNFSRAFDAPFRTGGFNVTNTTNGTNATNETAGTIIADDAMVRLEPGAKTPTPTTTTTESTATTTPTATPYPVVERTPLEPSSGTNAGIPFSPGLAVIALLLTGLIARRL
ncbi:hypothetical protein E6P09_06885 [Haloferax mediterranei ATCC 33500]|uniref:PGF-CTERM sorting domain-containing protein n=1 Tax=Haloferax mediterranei (strain ATCC 33500 / DSM 1411 / JCM 8866 / NBRC 14739 / NCIMB 2177 / R-4) TaxID=523841 RepID=M0J1K6_HALMT|nr:hypothetical protein [Haloferax mediterranei]EMA02233.1 hypothetical protein C439_06620 [Haloferax mediterranei ATCC 33500]MDX5988583.1 hypothetical protein [Haloferax mediterranei ATCC 33500]QCQ74998.1 hypothetical protein E6P09_06885 [Haloferax mediterranei ATCC 33500]